MNRGQALYDVLRLTRPLVLHSARVVEATWREHGVTVAMRAVLELLLERGPMTVPQLARDLDITRQGVQRTVDELERTGHVVARPNPAHRRSPLVTPTEGARRLFAEVHTEELAALAAMAGGLSEDDVAAARRVLAALHDGVRARAAGLAEGAARG